MKLLFGWTFCLFSRECNPGRWLVFGIFVERMLIVTLHFQEGKARSRPVCCNRQQEAAACSSSAVVSV